MKRKIIIILSSILSSSSSVASLFPALNLESTYLAAWKAQKWLSHAGTNENRIKMSCVNSFKRTKVVFYTSKTLKNLNYWNKFIIKWPGLPISSAGLLGLLLMKVSKASFMALMKLSLRAKQLCATLSILSLKSSRSCTMSLSFSGVHTISPPKVWNQIQCTYTRLRHKKTRTHLFWQ